MIALAALGFGLVPFFAKSLADEGMPASMVAFCRFMVTAVVLIPFLRFDKRGRVTTAWGILAGAAMSIGWVSYVEALKTVPVAVLGVLYMTYPVFTLLVGWVWLRDRPAGRSMLAAGLILIAAIITMTPASVAPENLPAMLLALAAPLSFGAAINILTSKLIHVPAISRIACVAAGAALGLAPLMLGLDLGAGFSIAVANLWLIGGLSLVTALLPQLMYSIHAPRIGAARTSMAGSVELPMMFLIGWFAFDERIGVVHFLAAVLVLTAIVVTPVRRHAAPPRNGAA